MTDRKRKKRKAMRLLQQWHDEDAVLAPAAACKPDTMEDLRTFLAGTVQQLVQEMAEKSADYCVPSDNVLGLLESVASVRGTSVWADWESWALRHAIPVHRLVPQIIAAPPNKPMLAAMSKRLRDLIGYGILGLVLCERQMKQCEPEVR